jgi:hypothetical protein
MKQGVRGRLYLWDHKYRFFLILFIFFIFLFFKELANIQSLCVTAYFAVRGRMTLKSRGCKWCVQCGGKVARNVLLKWRKRRQATYVCQVAVAYPFINNMTNLITYSSWETNLFCILLWVTVLKRFPCFKLVSISTHHISSKYNMIHQANTTLLQFKHAPSLTSVFKQAAHVTRHYYVTLHFTVYDYHCPWVCKW